MSDMHTKDVDLNLLKALELLLEERHVSRAAARSYLSQSAMSRTLSRLRETFGDELLVRTSAGYELTPRARVLEGELAVLMPRLRSMLRGDSFDPQTATDTVRMAATDFGLAMLGEHVFREFVQRAPHMSMIVDPVVPSSFDDVARGRIDLVISPIAAPPPLRRHTLFVEDFVCLLSRTHPVSTDRLTLDDVGKYPHARVSATQRMLVESRLDELGIHPPAALTFPYFAAVPAALHETSLIAILPRRFAIRHVGDALRIAEAPAEFRPFEYPMVWHPRLSRDPVHRWVRSLLRDSGAAIQGTSTEDPVAEGSSSTTAPSR